MKKYLYEGKNYEDALSHALEDQNTQEENLIITIKEITIIILSNLFQIAKKKILNHLKVKQYLFKILNSRYKIQLILLLIFRVVIGET